MTEPQSQPGRADTSGDHCPFCTDGPIRRKQDLEQTLARLEKLEAEGLEQLRDGQGRDFPGLGDLAEELIGDPFLKDPTPELLEFCDELDERRWRLSFVQARKIQDYRGIRRYAELGNPSRALWLAVHLIEKVTTTRFADSGARNISEASEGGKRRAELYKQRNDLLRRMANRIADGSENFSKVERAKELARRLANAESDEAEALRKTIPGMPDKFYTPAAGTLRNLL